MVRRESPVTPLQLQAVDRAPDSAASLYGSLAVSSNRTICATDGFPLQST
jgi:hypothetical protein